MASVDTSAAQQDTKLLELPALWQDRTNVMDAIEADRRQGGAKRVLAYFLAHPGQWLSTYELEGQGGRNAWRTRVSDARKKVEADGGVIQNRQRKRADGSICSEYRYLPAAPLGRDASVYVEQKGLF